MKEDVKRLTILVGLVLVSLGTLGCALYFSPYYFYVKIMAGKYIPEWYNVPISGTTIFTPTTYQHSNEPLQDDSPFWRPFQIGNFVLRISHHHPAIVPMPLIEVDETKKPIIGINFNDVSGKRLLSFRPLRIEVFQYGLSDTTIFSLPISRKILRERKIETLWLDLFNKDLKEYQIPMTQLLLNLHTLYMRWKYFPKNFTKISYFSPLQLGLIGLPSEDRDFDKYYVMKLVDGKLVTFRMEVRKDHVLAKGLFEKILAEINYAQGKPSLADNYYKEFKTLNYQDQIGEYGYLLLYSAYSHRPKSAAFFRELVRYLERQEKRPPQLPPLYDFGFNYFGSNFSTLEEERRETEEMALKRKMEEELEKELARYESMRLERGEFKDSEEKMNYQLQEAKKNKAEKRDKEIKGTVDGTITFE